MRWEERKRNAKGIVYWSENDCGGNHGCVLPKGHEGGCDAPVQSYESDHPTARGDERRAHSPPEIATRGRQALEALEEAEREWEEGCDCKPLTDCVCDALLLSVVIDHLYSLTEYTRELEAERDAAVEATTEAVRKLAQRYRDAFLADEVADLRGLLERTLSLGKFSLHDTDAIELIDAARAYLATGHQKRKRERIEGQVREPNHEEKHRIEFLRNTDEKFKGWRRATLIIEPEEEGDE